MFSIFNFLRSKRPVEKKKDDFFSNHAFPNPTASENLIYNLYRYLDFILTHVRSTGNVNLYPSYIYTHHLIQCLKEINHPILNNILNRSVHWFVTKQAPPTELSFNTYKVLSLFEFKHKLIQQYLKNTLSTLLKLHVNKNKEFHLQAFDGYLPSPMKQEEDSAISGANVLLRYHENLLIEETYLDDEGKSRLLQLVENSLIKARDQLWNRLIHRSYLYNMSSFLSAANTYKDLTGSFVFNQDINNCIIELNVAQAKNTGIWNDDLFQSAYIFSNIVSVRRQMKNDNRIEIIFKSFFDHFLENYSYQELFEKNVTHTNFLIMCTLIQTISKIMKNDDINEMVHFLRSKKFEI